MVSYLVLVLSVLLRRVLHGAGAVVHQNLKGKKGTRNRQCYYNYTLNWYESFEDI